MSDSVRQGEAETSGTDGEVQVVAEVDADVGESDTNQDADDVDTMEASEPFCGCEWSSYCSAPSANPSNDTDEDGEPETLS